MYVLVEIDLDLIDYEYCLVCSVGGVCFQSICRLIFGQRMDLFVFTKIID